MPEDWNESSEREGALHFGRAAFETPAMRAPHEEAARSASSLDAKKKIASS
jgi:hypothetical protein